MSYSEENHQSKTKSKLWIQKVINGPEETLSICIKHFQMITIYISIAFLKLSLFLNCVQITEWCFMSSMLFSFHTNPLQAIIIKLKYASELEIND